MKTLILLPFIILGSLAVAQKKLAVVKATSKNVAIKDGNELDKNAWTLSPKIRPDVFTAERTRKTKYVTFYTDIDSISVKVKPGSRYDFIILLNGKDSCYTRIESAVPPEDKKQPKLAIPDTIPFIRTAHEAISFQAIINETDTVMLHFDTGSWDVRLIKEAIIKKTKLLSDQPEYLAGKAAPNFNKINKVVKLQIGKQVFNNLPFAATDFTAHDMDGRFGWNLFEGKQVEIDYDSSLMIVHSRKLIKAPKGYTKSILKFKRSFMIVEGAMKKGDRKINGDFLMDTGAEIAIILDSTWAAQADFAEGLPLMKTITLTNPRGSKFETKVVLAPAFVINGFELTGIPTLILGTRNPAGFSVNTLGGDVLKRFNIIMDFKNDCIYWKPNTLFNLTYHKS
ncbi:hypothetical protein ACFQ3S_18915 [Mucilaginibacter terrae]|uniref:hypothetical protein n=1 Tax=Mucilaginibacter terrae TaxID=1955052 RepID=UPI00363ECA0A